MAKTKNGEEEDSRNVLFRRRKKLDLTEQEMAARTGLKQPKINRLEHGHKPRISDVQAVINGYDLPQSEVNEWLEEFGVSASDSPFISYEAEAWDQPDWKIARHIIERWLSPQNLSRESSLRSLALKTGVEWHALSRFLRGETKLDTSDAMKVFGEISKDLTSLDRRVFVKAMGLLPFFGFGKHDPRTVMQADRDLEMVEPFPKYLYQARIAGNSQLAIDIGDHLSPQLKQLVHRAPTEAHRKKFVRILGRIIYELNTAEREIVPTHDVLEVTEWRANEMFDFAKQYEMWELAALADYSLSDAHYIRGDYMKAAPGLMDALPDLIEPNDELAVLRVLELVGTKLPKQDKDIFSTVRLRFDRVMESGQPISQEQLCETLEGFARAQGARGLDQQAFTTLDEGWRVLNEMKGAGEMAPMREIQLLRAQFDLGRSFGSTPADLENIGNHALRLAIQIGSKRKEQMFKTWLEGMSK